MITHKEKEYVDLYDLMFDLNSGHFDFDDPTGMDNFEDYGFVRKDVFDGDLLKVDRLGGISKDAFNLICSNGLTVSLSIKKERKFFNVSGFEFQDHKELKDWLLSEESNKWFVDNNIYVYVNVDNGTIIGSLMNGYYAKKREEFLDQSKDANEIYMARIISKNNGGFLVNVDGVEAFLPGSLAAANKIINFDSYVEKEIPVMFEDFIMDGETFIVSNKKYIAYILPKRIAELDLDNQYNGIVTGTIKFGIFIEFNDILTGLLHVSEMSPDTLYKFRQREYHPGDSTDFYIKEISKDNKLILSEYKGKNANVSIEEFKEGCEYKVCQAKIVSIKRNIGAFLKFEYNGCDKFIGLLHVNEFTDDLKLEVGESIDVYVSRVDANTNKIFTKLPR